jgi:putative ABC transport system permease protein
MIRATLKSLLSRKLRLLLSGLAVILGVMSVASALVVTDSLSRSYTAMFSTAYQAVDVSVMAKPKIDTGTYITAPGLLPASVLDQLRLVSGVAAVSGSVNTAEVARVIGKDGKVVTTFGAPRFGVNWTGDNPYVTLQSGRAPQSDDEVAINGGLAKTTGYKVGDRIDILTLRSRQTFTVVGVFGYYGNRDSLAGETMVAFTTPAAQQLLIGAPGEFTAINMRAVPGVSQDQLRDRVVAALGPGYQVKTGAQLAADSSNQINQALQFFSYILLGFAFVSLFVGVFLILNTFSIIVAQRMRELALLRAMGAGRGQVVTSVLTEAVIVGLISSAVGLGLGVGLGRLLAWLYSTFLGGGVNLAPLAVPGSAVVSSFAVGIVVTMVAALVPALRAARIPPVAAMREAATPDRSLTRITVSGAVVTAAGGALLWVGLTASGNTLAALLIGLLLALTGVALLTPAVVRPVIWVLGRAFGHWMPGLLGARNSARNPRRTGTTASALMIGIALIAGINVVLTSATASLSHTLNTQIHADLIISGDTNGPLPATFDGAVLNQIQSLPGVSSVVGVTEDIALINGQETGIAAVNDVSAMQAMTGMSAKEGSISGLGADQIIVDEPTATSLGLHAGATVNVQLSKGELTPYQLVGVYKQISGINGWITGQAATANFRSAQPALGFIQLTPGTSTAQVKAQVAALLANSPEVNVTDRSGYVQQQTNSLNTLLTLVEVLLALSIIIALLGIVNTLALSVIERTRELGLLRAVGLRRRQMMSMVGAESVVTSFFGALMGTVVGTGLGAVVVAGLHSQGIDTLGIPWAQLFTYLIVGAVVGVIASVVPAIRAARLNVLAAIAYE